MRILSIDLSIDTDGEAIVTRPATAITPQPAARGSVCANRELDRRRSAGAAHQP